MKRPLPFLTGLVLVGAGVAAMLFPKKGADLYGLPTTDRAGLGFAKASGVRDIVMGAMLLSAPREGRNLMFALTLVSILDAVNVATTSEDPPALSLGIHSMGIVGSIAFALMTPGAMESE